EVRARYEQRRDGRLAPRGEPVADPLARTDQRDLVDERIRYRGDGFTALAREEQVLDLLRLGRESHPRHQLLVEVAVLRAHPAEVEAERGLLRNVGGGEVI